MQFMRTRRPFTASVMDAVGNEIFRVRFNALTKKCLHFIKQRNLFFALWSCNLLHNWGTVVNLARGYTYWAVQFAVHGDVFLLFFYCFQVRRPMFLINSSIYIEVDGEVCLLAIVPHLCKMFWLYRLSDNNNCIAFLRLVPSICP